MIGLNLISPKKKQELHLIHIYVVVKNLIISVLLIAIFVAITLLVTKAVLEKHFRTIVEQTTQTTRYANIFNIEVKKFNRLVDAIAEIQKQHIIWPDFLAHFTPLVPQGIVLKNVTVTNNLILVKGFAQTRDNLLTFQKNLEASPRLGAAEIPLDQLLKKETIEFDLKAPLTISETSL